MRSRASRPQAIYDAVGDKIQEIFDAQVVCIAFLEPSGARQLPVPVERGERSAAEPRLSEPTGSRDPRARHRASRCCSEEPRRRARTVRRLRARRRDAQVLALVPLLTGGAASGAHLTRTTSIARRLRRVRPTASWTTLAGSLSVALENARLVHETRQRNAELGLINSVQDALAGELELQAIYDAVGDDPRRVRCAGRRHRHATRRPPAASTSRTRSSAACIFRPRADRAHGLPEARDGDPRVAPGRRDFAGRSPRATATRSCRARCQCRSSTCRSSAAARRPA